MSDEIEPTLVSLPVVAPPTTSKVRIDAGGREIELETTTADASVEVLATTALALWRATGADVDERETRSLFGLVTSERAHDRIASSTLEEPLQIPH